jgi:hypothetical protein
MDIAPPPPHSTTEPEADFTASHIFALMLEQLADALPPLETETPASAARRQEVARAMVIATHPADPIEAALAISAAVAYQTSLTCSALAAAPGLDGVQSNRHARTAIAQHRAFHAGVQALDMHRGATTAQPVTPRRTRTASRGQPEPEPQPDNDPIPHLPQFQPRNRHGEPIPLYRFRDMTRLQKLAVYGDPFDTAAWAAATEEEDAASPSSKPSTQPSSPPPDLRTRNIVPLIDAVRQNQTASVVSIFV